MSRKTIDITGQKFGMLTVVEKVGATETNISLWKCKCDCGNEKVVPRKNLIGGGTRSCGCLHSKKQLQHGNAVRGSRTKLYNIWISMRQRCSNSSHRYYKRYGGRGISVCGEWETFEAFEKWALQNGYSDGLTIDRINNDGNYEPGNCQWITRQEHGRKHKK